MTTPSANRWILAALCLALLVLRVGGVHLHLCFDGSEPPLSYHLADSGIHHAQQEGHAAGHEEPHTDRDVTAAADLLTKSTVKDGALVLTAFTLLLFLISRPRASARTAYHSPPKTTARSHWRPPLRGPPALI